MKQLKKLKKLKKLKIEKMKNNWTFKKNEDKNEKMEKLWEKIQKWKNLKKWKQVFFYSFFIISYKFGAYIKIFWYTLITNWHYLWLTAIID